MPPAGRVGLSPANALAKRTIDIVGATLGLVLTGWLILLAAIAATIDTHRPGFFVQERIGRRGRPFKILKIRTMCDLTCRKTTVTTDRDPRVTRLGRSLRRLNLDELPQLVNVLRGEMSLVGPRPDVRGFADALTGADRIILSVRPGLTGPASLKYRHEDRLLSRQRDPERYNREVLYPDKVRLNRRYVEEYSLAGDIGLILTTLGCGLHQTRRDPTCRRGSSDAGSPDTGET